MRRSKTGQNGEVLEAFRSQSGGPSEHGENSLLFSISSTHTSDYSTNMPVCVLFVSAVFYCLFMRTNHKYSLMRMCFKCSMEGDDCVLGFSSTVVP